MSRKALAARASLVVRLREALLQCDVLSTLLPGRVGRYLLPHDAVILLKRVARTSPESVRTFLKEEGALQASVEHQRLNHVTYDMKPCEEPQEDNDEEEDEGESTFEDEEPVVHEEEEVTDEEEEDPLEWEGQNA